jgi:CDP-4-dehydro-6-deoxyglucose reductase
MPSGAFEAQLVSARTLAPSVRELTFERTDGAPMAFEPGQWINLVWSGEGSELKRAYSIASAPSGTPRFELAVTRVEGGPGSTRLHAMREGERIRCVGPSGFFARRADDPTPAVFVATGTGLTPLRSMIAAALGVGSKAPMRLVFGVRHEADVLYRDELARWERDHGVRVHVVLSQPNPGWNGLSGWVQHHLVALAPELRGPDAVLWVCGLDRMVSAVRALAKDELGLDRKRIKHERYDAAAATASPAASV